MQQAMHEGGRLAGVIGGMSKACAKSSQRCGRKTRHGGHGDIIGGVKRHVEAPLQPLRRLVAVGGGDFDAVSN